MQEPDEWVEKVLGELLAALERGDTEVARRLAGLAWAWAVIEDTFDYAWEDYAGGPVVEKGSNEQEEEECD